MYARFRSARLRTNLSRRLPLLAILFATCWPATAPVLAREAVKKAMDATVAIEWRAAESGQHQPAAQASPAREKPAAETYNALLWTPYTNVGRLHTTAPEISLASGTVVSDDGLVVTISPVPVEGRHSVTFDDGRTFSARIVVDDRRSGLRLLKIDAQDLVFLPVAEADADVGDPVFATYCTSKRRRVAAQGMIAARGDLAPGRPGNLLQVDLAAGRMSAGAPVVDAEGRLVGLLAEKGQGEQDTTGSLAVPAEAVRALLRARQGENTVVVHRGFLGIQLSSKNEDDQEHVYIQVLPDSPAAKADLRDNDELLAIGGKRISSPGEAAGLVMTHSPGEKVAVTVRRDNEEKEVEVTVGRPNAGLERSADAPTKPGDTAPLAANVVQPDQFIVFTPDGKQVAVKYGSNKGELRADTVRLRATRALHGLVNEPSANVIRVERSDLEKKLEEVGHDVQSLRQQVEKLTEELKSLRDALAERR